VAAQADDPRSAELVDDALYVLSRSGPGLGRPLVDTITASKIKNLKELRPPSSGTSRIRILFALDPWRSAILLVAGNKEGKWKRWVHRSDPESRASVRGLPEGTGGRGAQLMSGYIKWDRAGYIERVGGPEEAERRRKQLMARQTGYRLAEERKRQGLTQAQLAEVMGATPGRVSQIERGGLATIEAVARYVEALGGRLDLISSFGDHTLTVIATEAA
jgi:DNA-binding XRE family transcriptional regulator